MTRSAVLGCHPTSGFSRMKMIPSSNEISSQVRCRANGALLAVLWALLVTFGCGDPLLQPTAVRNVAGDYRLGIGPSSMCSEMNIAGGGAQVSISQTGVNIDATVHSIVVEVVLSGSVLGDLLSVTITMGTFNPFSGSWTASGSGSGTIRDDTITGSFAGSITQRGLTGPAVVCQASDHVFTLTRIK